MLERVFIFYVDSFKGLRREVWWLALVTLINRAGTMVVPFLSLYLTAELEFSLTKVGWILSIFGIGSVVGSWFGGKLADKLGYYPVLFWSLVISGIMFIGLQFITSFIGFCIAVFFLMVVADALRPAIYVAINAYSKPENRTRSVTLIRLAINLGFSMGPAAGGLIITLAGYNGLFWADGITCILAGIMFVYLLDRKKAQEDKNNQPVHSGSPYRDGPYLLFLLIVMIIAFAFLQLFSTIPVFYRDIHFLSEEYIGLLIAGNGLLIFAVEMPLIKFIENRKFSIYLVLFISSLLLALSFLLLNLTLWTGILAVGMFFITVGEMLNFPFLNRFALDRAERGKSGEYMALFTIAFSFGHIFGPKAGMNLVDSKGYDFTWYFMTGAFILVAFLLIVLRNIISAETKNQKSAVNVRTEMSENME